MAVRGISNKTGWFENRRKERGLRALQRQLEYQEKKAASIADSREVSRSVFLRSQAIRQKLEKIKPITSGNKILEVGSGAHGLIFGFGGNFGVGIDPLAVDYKRLFPAWQDNAQTIAAIGEELPFDDGSFEIVLSDNVIDHAENPVKIVDELVRVLGPGGLLYFTVNIHHPIYDFVSRAHGMWNSFGVRLELSAFADHTVHFTESQIRNVFAHLPLQIVEQTTTVSETIAAQRTSKAINPDALLKKLFFKNALFEAIAVHE
jgi:Methylase involved in ubiquinone/menaquinone biosynthesis